MKQLIIKCRENAEKILEVTKQIKKGNGTWTAAFMNDDGFGIMNIEKGFRLNCEHVIDFGGGCCESVEEILDIIDDKEGYY